MKTLTALTAAAAIAAAIGTAAPAHAGNYGGYTSNYDTHAATQYCYRQVWNGYRWVTEQYVCTPDNY